MIQNKHKLAFLVGIGVLMLLIPDLGTTTSPTYVDSPGMFNNIAPESAFKYDPNEIMLDDGTNIGLVMNSTAQIQDTASGGDWGYYNAEQSITQTPWIFPLPSRMYTTKDWYLKSGTVTVSQMSATDNYIPSTTGGAYFQNVANGWIYPSAKSYSDSYWGSGSSTQFVTGRIQTFNPANGYVPAGSGSPYYLAGTPDFGDTSGGAGYVQLNSPKRQYTYPMNVWKTSYAPSIAFNNKTVVSQSHLVRWNRVQDGGAWAEVGRNTVYNTNRRGTNAETLLDSNADLQSWCSTKGAFTESIIDNSYTDNSVGFRITKQTYYGNYYNWDRYYQTGQSFQVSGNIDWDVTHRAFFTYSQKFFYQRQTVGQQTFNYSANIEMSAYGQLKDNAYTGTYPASGNFAGGSYAVHTSMQGGVYYYIRKISTGETIASYYRDVDYTASSGAINNAYHDANDMTFNLQDYSEQWYEFRIVFDIRIRTRGSASGTGVFQGDPGNDVTRSSTVNIPYTEHTDGLNVYIYNPQIKIYESSPIAQVGQSTQEIMVTQQAATPWNRGIVPGGATLQYAYRVPDTFRGADFQSRTLENIRMRTKLEIEKPEGVWTTYTYDNPVAFNEVRAYNHPTYGYGCSRVIWVLDENIRANLNRAENIRISVGVVLTNQLEIYRDIDSTGVRVYFRKLDFTVSTVPSAEYLNMKLLFTDSTMATRSFSFVDHPTLPQATLSFTEGVNDICGLNGLYWDTGSTFPNDKFNFLIDSSKTTAFTYSATFVAGFEDWDNNKVKIYTTSSKTYYEMNNTVVTPKPYSYGQYFGGPGLPLVEARWQQYWNDNFHMAYVIPRFSISGLYYWNLDLGYDSNFPGVILNGEENVAGWSKNNEFYVQETPPNGVFGLPSQTYGNIQVVYLDYLLYDDYTRHSYTGHGVDTLTWNVRFSSPNEISAIVIDNDIAFTGQTSFYSLNSTGYPDRVHIRGTKANDLTKSGTTIVAGYRWVDPTGTPKDGVNSSTNLASTPGTYNDIAQLGWDRAYQIQGTDIKGPGYTAYTYLWVSDVCNGPRTTGRFLGGPYRAGVRHAGFSVMTMSQLTGFQITNTQLSSSIGITPQYTLLYNSTNKGDLSEIGNPAQMMNMSFRWMDGSNPIYGGNAQAVLSINHWRFKDVEGNPTSAIEPAFNNIVMKSNNNGYYWVLLDPMDMNHIGGNISRGYHEFNITCTATGFDSIFYQGNFSILLDTILEIKNPSHGSVDLKGRHHYDDSSLIANDPYTIKAVYYINKTSGGTELINNEAGSLYQGNVIMTYNLTNIYLFEDWSSENPDKVPYANFVNKTYFVDRSLPDPSSGVLSNEILDGSFSADILWPRWDSGDVPLYYGAADYLNQDTYQKVLEYNISVYVRVNRTKSATQFQPHDLERQDGEGIKDTGISGWPEVVKVREESILLKLNNPQAGNYSRILLTNNIELDGNPFGMGVYDNDSKDVMNWNEGLFNPTYFARNYQNNASYSSGTGNPANSFRFRIVANCTKAALHPESGYYAGMNGNDFVPFGPITENNLTYGMYHSWMKDAIATLDGWNSTAIPLLLDRTNNWSTWVNQSGTPYLASAATFVTPWLQWDDLPTTEDLSGQSLKLYINFRKTGFVGSSQLITLQILPANTTILNGSSSLGGYPKIPQNVFNFTSTAQITSVWGKTVSFKVNFTDTTNYKFNGQLMPITGAKIQCLYAPVPIYKNDSISNPNPSVWSYINHGDGTYTIIINYELALGVSATAGDKEFDFQLSQKNYTSASFKLKMTINKRAMALDVLESLSTFEDYYYYYQNAPPEWALPLEITKLNIVFQLLDLDDNNATIDVDRTILKNFLFLAKRIGMVGEFNTVDLNYEIVKYQNGTGAWTYNISIASTMAPVEYNARISTNIGDLKYFDNQTYFNFTISPGEMVLETFPVYSVDSAVYYYINTDSSQRQPTIPLDNMPSYLYRCYDAHHLDKFNNPIYFLPDLGVSPIFTINSNFVNTYRTANRINSGGTAGPNINAKVDYDFIAGTNYMKYYLDISGYPTIPNGGGFDPRSVDLTFSKANFLPVYDSVLFTITNASTRIQTDTEDTLNHVSVRVQDVDTIQFPTSIVDGLGVYKYQSVGTGGIHLPFSNTVYYDYFVQVYVRYAWADSNHAENQNIKTNALGDELYLAYTSTVAPGVTITTYPLSAEGNFAVLYFDARPLAGSGNVDINFTIWKKNFNPVNYRVSFNMQPRKTVAFLETAQDSTQYSGKIKYIVRYLDDTGVGIDKQNILNAKIYPNGNMSELAAIAISETGEVKFDSGYKANFTVDMLSPGRYEIELSTLGLDVRESLYFVNLTIALANHQPQPILKNGLLPGFKVLPVSLKIRLWLTEIDGIPPTGEETSVLLIDPEKSSVFFVWAQVYVEVLNEKDELVPQLIDKNVSLTCTVYDANEIDPDTNARKLVRLWSFNLTWSEQFGFFTGKVEIEHTEEGMLDPIKLAGSNAIRISAVSDIETFRPAEKTTYFVVNTGVGYVPTWVWLIAAVAIGSVAIIGAVGVRKALQLRIPYILRMIDESIDKISKDKFPTVGIMLGRKEFVINKVIDYLDLCGIEWAIDDKIEGTDTDGGDEGEEGGSGSGPSGAPMSMDEITVALNKLEHLTPDERALFIDELKRLDRKGQEEFLQSLKDDSK